MAPTNWPILHFRALLVQEQVRLTFIGSVDSATDAWQGLKRGVACSNNVKKERSLTMKRSTTGLLLGSALVLGLSGCASSGGTGSSSERSWYQEPFFCAIAGGLVGGGIGYAIDDDDGDGPAIGSTVGATAAALLCHYPDREPVAEPEPMPAPAPPPPPEFEPVVLSSDVNFAFDSAQLQPAAESRLNEVAATLRQNPQIRVNIEGHTDAVGSNEYNRGLSQRRADSVASYLMSRGIDGNRLRTMGYGEERPVATNETPAGRAMNRRVEISSQ
jgi:OOP family OmpA-OmpF porin